MNASETLLSRRDQKVAQHLRQYAPVWLVNETTNAGEETINFNVVFDHSTYGWVSRRYRYDGFNDVLYHLGQNSVSPDRVDEITVGPPYLDATTINTAAAYGG
jgi:hypothetical protein